MDAKMTWSEWQDLQQKFEDLPNGSILADSDCEYWIKPEQSELCRLEGMLVNIRTGALIHWTKVTEYEVISWSNIPV